VTPAILFDEVVTGAEVDQYSSYDDAPGTELQVSPKLCTYLNGALNVGGVLLNVYTDVATGDARPTKSQVMALRVVVAAEIDTLVGCVEEAVAVEQVGSTPFVV
jgi:hypothetical protein